MELDATVLKKISRREVGWYKHVSDIKETSLTKCRITSETSEKQRKEIHNQNQIKNSGKGRGNILTNRREIIDPKKYIRIDGKNNYNSDNFMQHKKKVVKYTNSY